MRDNLAVLDDYRWHTSTPVLEHYPPRKSEDSSRALLEYADGTVRFKHTCRVVGDVQLVTTPRLQGHSIISRAPWTIEPSIACDDCGTHGHVRNGRWIHA